MFSSLKCFRSNLEIFICKMIAYESCRECCSGNFWEISDEVLNTGCS